MTDPVPLPAPGPLHCAFCSAVWDSGTFFGAVVYARPPGQDRVPLLACHLCQATRTDADLQQQFDAAIGQRRPARERPNS